MRERENLFTDFLSELRRREKDEKHLKKEQVSYMTSNLRENDKKAFLTLCTNGISHAILSLPIHSSCTRFLCEILCCVKSQIMKLLFLKQKQMTKNI